MIVLMTGATGLIGHEIGKRLVQQGHTVRILSRNPERAKKSLPFPVEAFPWKVGGGALEGVEGVIHLAGEPIAEGRWTRAKKQRIRSSRVAGTHDLVQAFQRHPGALSSLKVWVQASAIGYYGDAGDEICYETRSPGPDFLAQVCSEWEAAAQEIRANEAGRHVRQVTIRTGIVLSRRGGALEKMRPVFRRGLGGALGSGRQWMSWIHIEDIARLFLHALEAPEMNGPYNGVAPVPVTNRHFSRELAGQYGHALFLTVPKPALKVALGEMASAVLGSQRCSSEKVEKTGFQFHFPLLSDALHDVRGHAQEGEEELIFEQWVPHSVSDVFRFFSNEKNLEVLTPPFLQFHVLRKSTPEITGGTLIDYRLRLHGWPMQWQSKIEEWEPGRKFVDTQTRGPYRSWHHTHEFEAMGSGTLIRDRILYRVPMGWVGRLLAGGKVVSDVGRIFEFRRQKIGELFGDIEKSP